VPSHTCFIPFKTAWTFEGLVIAFSASVLEVLDVNSGVNGEETGVASSASNVLELDNLYQKKNNIQKQWNCLNQLNSSFAGKLFDN